MLAPPQLTIACGWRINGCDFEVCGRQIAAGPGIECAPQLEVGAVIVMGAIARAEILVGDLGIKVVGAGAEVLDGNGLREKWGTKLLHPDCVAMVGKSTVYLSTIKPHDRTVVVKAHRNDAGLYVRGVGRKVEVVCERVTTACVAAHHPTDPNFRNVTRVRQTAHIARVARVAGIGRIRDGPPASAPPINRAAPKNPVAAREVFGAPDLRSAGRWALLGKSCDSRHQGTC